MKFKDVLNSLRPSHLVGQVALLALAGVVIYQFILVIMFHVLDIEGKPHYVSEAAFITSLFFALDSAPQSKRANLIDEIKTAAPYTNILLVQDAPEQEKPKDPVIKAELSRIKSFLWANSNVYLGAEHFRDTLGSFVVKLRDGEYAVIAISQHKKPSGLLWRWAWEPEPDIPFYLTRWARMAFLFFISAGIMIIWISNTIITPLIELAKQAESLPDDDEINITPLPLGPVEVRNLKRSIIRTQDRILKMISAQKRMIAALTHDLRSITTRLKLRAEFIQDDEVRSKIHNDVRIMEAMLIKNLQYLQADHRRENFSLLDLDTVLQTVINEFSDSGINIEYSGGSHQKIMGCLPDMIRVFTNLVENASRFGKNISISICNPKNGFITIEVVDDGPGIDPEIVETVFEPFVRGNIGRALDEKGGFGLGLSIVQSIVKNHNGYIYLHNKLPHGLIASVLLPVTNSAEITL
jgi:signal transduction histidine kinase